MEIAKQQYAIQQIKAGGLIFLTAGAGRGKSWVIDQIEDQYTIKCAPTGIAALNIQGMTAHRMFGLPLNVVGDTDHYDVSKKVKELLQNLLIKRIVIDEVSMLRADYLDLIDKKLKVIRNNDAPFGGLQVVVVGDFFQLEPVVHWTEEKEYFKKYPSAFCFNSKCWDFQTIELTEGVRLTDQTQLAVLNSIRRKDEFYEQAIDWIHNNALPYDPKEEVLHLCCYKTDAKAVNRYWYKKIDAQERVYKANYSGKWDTEAVVDTNLKLKVGAKVLIKANNPENGYVNGDRGVVKITGKDYVIVELLNGKEVTVVENTWERYSYKVIGDGVEKVADEFFTQIPITLGWAITVHSSQSLTLDDIALDLGRGAFSHGQLYTALSRVRNLKNIRIVEPIREEDCIVREEVTEFYDSIGEPDANT